MFPKKHTLFGTATVNTKGQFVLPVAARKNAHINPGDQLLVVGIDDVLIGLVKIDNIDHVIKHLQSIKKMGEKLPALLRPKSLNDRIHDLSDHIDDLQTIKKKTTSQA